MSAHAMLAPSAAHKWMACPGSLAMERACGVPDTSSEHADEGTAAHELAARCLGDGIAATACIGDSIIVNGREFVVTDEFAAHVQTYIDGVHTYRQDGGLYVETRVDFSSFVGVPKSTGTSDAIVLVGTTLQVHDLKFGRGVRVDAERNEQLMLYALGALAQFDLDLLGGIERVVMVIHQPRLDHVSEWECSADDLRAWARTARERAADAVACLTSGDIPPAMLNPGDKQCRWCKAKPTCPALAERIEHEVGADFDNVGDVSHAVKGTSELREADLARAMAAVDLVEGWCKAVRAECERRMLAGVPVAGWKLVEGRRGARKWADETDAESTLKAMRVKHDQMYDYSVISPTSAEKLVKAGTLGERQWKKLQPLIVQSEGKPSVAPATDKRPAVVVTPTADEFAPVVDTVEELI